MAISKQKNLHMKTIVKILLILAVLIPAVSLAQKGHKHHPHKGNKNKEAVVNNKPHYKKHPQYKQAYKVYHPVWAPHCSYKHRWIYFPGYNCYWDNYSNMYVYWGGLFWIRTSSPPPILINVNLGKVKRYELDDDYDGYDNIYYYNPTHKKLYITVAVD